MVKKHANSAIKKVTELIHKRQYLSLQIARIADLSQLASRLNF